VTGPERPDEPEVPADAGPERPDEADRPGSVRPPVDVARQALAAARAEARRRGLGTRSGVAGSARGTTGRTGRSRRVDPGTRSGAHPDDHDPQLLGSTVQRLVSERGWETDAAVGGVMGRWGAVVGTEVAEHCEPVSFDDGELVVRAVSTAWATQLRLLAPALVRRLNEDLGAGTVRTVRVLGPGGPSWGRGPLRVPGRGPRDTYG
jgi:predicted nucleic acid-binding Zn ribbon protein